MSKYIRWLIIEKNCPELPSVRNYPDVSYLGCSVPRLVEVLRQSWKCRKIIQTEIQTIETYTHLQIISPICYFYMLIWCSIYIYIEREREREREREWERESTTISAVKYQVVSTKKVISSQDVKLHILNLFCIIGNNERKSLQAHLPQTPTLLANAAHYECHAMH